MAGDEELAYGFASQTLGHTPATLPGTSQSSKTSSHVLEPRMPSLSSLGEVLKPLKPFSMMNAVMPRGPSLMLVLAYTTSTSASGPLVIQNLLPFRMYLSPVDEQQSHQTTTATIRPLNTA